MATLDEIRQNPSDYLGTSNDAEADREAYSLYFETVERLNEIYTRLTDDIPEGENPQDYGILADVDTGEIAFDDGDFVARCEELAAMGAQQIADAWFRA